MKFAVKNSLSSVLVLALLALTACRREARNENPDTPPASVAPAPATASTADHAEVFRRAFWRHPTAADRILQAERRVSPADDSWRWFIQLHPSPELLAALRDPDSFGLLRLPLDAPPRHWSAASDTPDWFPAAATPPGLVTATTGFEILQAPSSGLTVLYRASDNMLYATDHGSGFAPPAR